MVSHCEFDLHFLDDAWNQEPDYLYVLLWEIFLFLAPFFNQYICSVGLGFFLQLNYVTSLYILDIKLFSDKYFLTFCRLCFHIADFSFAMQKLFMCLFPAWGSHACLFLLSLLLYFWCTVHKIIARTISKSFPGASLVVQWIRICLAMQGTQVWSLAWEDSMCRRAVKWSSTTTKPVL